MAARNSTAPLPLRRDWAALDQRHRQRGVLGWTPATAGTANFEVVATHEDAEGRQTFTIVVNGVVLKVTQISAGWNHPCAVTTAGGLKCWGNDYNGQLGDGGTNTDKTTPVDVQP